MIDNGYTVARCKDSLAATTALVVGAHPGERKHWVNREAYWKQQLTFAQNRSKEAS